MNLVVYECLTSILELEYFLSIILEIELLSECQIDVLVLDLSHDCLHMPTEHGWSCYDGWSENVFFCLHFFDGLCELWGFVLDVVEH